MVLWWSGSGKQTNPSIIQLVIPIQEIDIASGDVLFNWTTFDHISLDESYNNISLTHQGGSEANPFDAVHINSIDKVWIVESRNPV
jgi:hypothetical protein